MKVSQVSHNDTLRAPEGRGGTVASCGRVIATTVFHGPLTDLSGDEFSYDLVSWCMRMNFIVEL